MSFLRLIFFGLVQVIELPINALIELWRLPGRGRGLLLGMPSIFVLILTLLTIGWAKYGSNQDLVKDYWQEYVKERKALDALTMRIGDSGDGASQLGEADDASLTTQESAESKRANETRGIANSIIKQIQREIYLPERLDLESDPRARLRVQFGSKGSVAKLELAESSGWDEWDRAFQSAVRNSEVFSSLADSSQLPSNIDLELGYDETQREKLRYKLSITLKKLIDLDPGNPNYKYEYGILSDEMGQIAQARLVMDQIASPERPGLSKAHIWQARQIWDDKYSNEPPNSRRQRCRQHLELALKADPTNLDANEGLGELFFSVGNFVEAERHYRFVWEQKLSTTLRLVAIYKQQQAKAKLDDLLAKSKDRLKEALALDPKSVIYVFDIERLCLLQAQEKVLQAQGLQQRGQIPEAERSMEESRLFIEEAIAVLKANLNEENKVAIHSRLSRIYSGWAKADAVQNAGKFTREAFDKTRTALEYDPKNSDALWILTVIGTQTSDFAQEARAIFDPVKNRDTATGEVLREYASYLMLNNKYDEAFVWLEDAHKRSPKDLIISNNLAYLTLTSNPPNPEKALELITEAINNAPNLNDSEIRSSLYDTKAAALIALKRYTEAIPFLEIVSRDRGRDLSEPQRKAKYRLSLSALRDCYVAIGEIQLAENYQRRLDELDAPTTSNN